MIKINDTSKLGCGTLEDHGTLADSELDAVSGGATAAPPQSCRCNHALGCGHRVEHESTGASTRSNELRDADLTV